MSDRCNITLHCAGQLLPVVYRNNAQIAARPAVGMLDWTSRHASAAQPNLPAAEFITATTGPTDSSVPQRFVLAVSLAFDPSESSTATLTLNKQTEATTSFTQFVFRRDGAFSTIEGVESGIEKKTLSYNLAAQNVEVFLNGVKKTRNVDYWLFGDAQTTLANSIQFTSLISTVGIAQVDVVVSAQVSVQPKSLTLRRNKFDESRVGIGAWENVDAVLRFEAGVWQPYYLFTADINSSPLTTVEQNAVYTANSTVTINETDGSFLSTSALLLLAHAPYTHVDRYVTLAVPLSRVTGANHLRCSTLNGANVLQITSDASSNIYPPLRLVKFNADPLIDSTSAGVADSIVIDGAAIVGPDA